jgi:predicted dehydrogenase/aryl-alcohol dehydrogenase-like predicted oxidoreductase
MNTEQVEVRWAILGAGNIARSFANHLPHSESGRLVAVASRSLERAEAFASEFDSEIKPIGSYDELVAMDGVDAVYVATPHPQHAEWTIKLLRSGKHVLCEKPICLNAADAEVCIDVAATSGKVLMEAFMYRCHPLAAKLAEVIRNGKIGRVQCIDTSFSFRAGDNPEGRLLNANLGGGGILDVGCYTTSLARLLAGAAMTPPKNVAEPTKVTAVGHLGETGVDEWTVASLDFGDGILAQLRTGVRLSSDNTLYVFGTKGSLTCDNVFIPTREGGEAEIAVKPQDGEEERITVTVDKPLYALEADAFAKAIRDGEANYPAMTPADTLGNMRVLDQWREAIGLTYPIEKLDGYRSTTVSGSDLKRRHEMPTGRVDGLDKPVSRFVMGVDNHYKLTEVAPIYDNFFEAGGNTWDTAHCYGKGRSRVLGEWLKLRGVREDVNIIFKGAHPPFCRPEAVRKQIEDQLDWMQVDACELYFLHRDNVDVPIGEWVDVLNECHDANLIRGSFGGSNWSLERVKEASAWAKANAKRGFGAVSQNLALAVMEKPMWNGCVTAHDPAWLGFLQETQMANFSWSSQARGFFVPNRDLEDEMIQHAFMSDANMARRERCFDLAKLKDVTPTSIAAAWVLAQPFPSFGLIGPRATNELRTTLEALDVELTADEVTWLANG